MSKEDLAAWDVVNGYDGSQDFAAFGTLTGKTLVQIAGVWFDVYKAEDVDATGTIPKLKENAKPVKEGATEKDTDGEVLGLTIDTSDLAKGDYWIFENKDKSTYIGKDGELLTGAKAVPMKITLPMMNDKGVIENGHLYPKNTEEKPKVTKDFEGGEHNGTPGQRTYNIGDKVPYEIKTKIPADTKYKAADWSDNMTKGLKFNNDITITLDGTPLAAGDYAVTLTEQGFVLKLTQDGLDKINAGSKEKDIVIKYTATLTDDVEVEELESNDVTFHYGNKPNHGNTPVTTEPENGKITAKKTWADGTVPSGVTVKFSLYNAQTGDHVETKELTAEQLNGADVVFEDLEAGVEYKVVEEWNGYAAEYKKEANGVITVNNHKDENPPPETPNEPKVKTGGKKFIKVDGTTVEALAGAKFKVYRIRTVNGVTGNMEYLQGDGKTWGAEGTAKVFETEKDGIIDIKGLQYSEAKETVDGKEVSVTNQYFIKETEAPEGYAPLNPDTIKFTVDENSYSSDPQKIEQIKNFKVTIPVTGGIGSVIFVVAGLAIMGATLVIKRRRNATQM